MADFQLKFLIDEQTAEHLWARADALKLARGRRTRRRLRSHYLDTPEHALQRAGIELRLQHDGRHWVQFVAVRSPSHSGLTRTSELESKAPGGRLSLDAIPDNSIREMVIGSVNGSSLHLICETVLTRSAGELVLECGTRAELAISSSEIRAADRSVVLREAEIGLIEGAPSDLFDMARALFPEGHFRFSRLSAAARGYRLATDDRIDDPLAPRTAEIISLNPAQTSEQAARAILRECLDQVATNMAVVQQLDDPEGPHQLRVGLRRLRSAFAIFSPAFESSELTRLGEEARWLGREVGKLRDIEVVTNEVVRREAQAHSQQTGFSTLQTILDGEIAERREHLRQLLAESRSQAFIMDLARFVEMRGWLVAEDMTQTERLAVPVREFADKALSRTWKKTRKRAHHLDAMNQDQRHDLRKAAKTLRYAVEFFSPLYPAKAVHRFVKRLKKLQKIFGEVNDAATVKSLLDDDSRSGDPKVERAIGWVIGASQARGELGWSGAKDQWRRFERTEHFWK
jgi:inorganic triphosphatase YgiF